MKTKIILFLLLAICSQDGHSQGMPVYDNTNFISLAKSLVESAKQTSQLLKTVEFLNEQKQRIEQVNSVIKQIRAVKEIIRNNQELVKVVQHDLEEVLNSPFIKPEEIERVTVSFHSIMDITMQDMEFMQQLLTSNLLKMTDAERLAILEAQKERSREMIVEVGLRTRRFKTIISFREMQSKINNRAINF
ncbi:conjugal transfer protein [Salinimicrobium sp. MT39]|uniref:Conjugal transfer protein n=1 Tax=Salinimicrobium profundisediminis TaxID=2994553 RepID=A0A9X3CYC0_9FLAO|nr:conjugal transfer protein [Salinimicrobium profundisediminis]MCX2839086.1 conjugal transfer protein [Salinimicrobium profundisediminis]